jgi:hypothetical protein
MAEPTQPSQPASLSLCDEDLEDLLQLDAVDLSQLGAGAGTRPATPPPEPRLLAPKAEPQNRPTSAMPSLGRQKSFITENAAILNRETKLAILSIVMMEIGPSVAMEPTGVKEVDINLDAVAEADEDVLGHIFNIVRSRLESLNQPVRPGGSDVISGGSHLH